ncbi:S9 family peptidase [Pyxidicoccus parkwayensis]|uniref:S9 family peptidase n=1 Tax=Pyxidicoccus parkwayensis TaxID=2813578 RepID=A0ABX7P511_9BACT|nr:prolyl oligopeptidase family serine peptidase [Pyxidicoccus parkwaysis]QSQ25536.1 S9 family peptidase [Pyxidicoccus parkwaysis]
MKFPSSALLLFVLTGCATAQHTPPATRDSIEHRAQALRGVYSDHAPTLTHDGRRLVFTSTRSGLSQLYIADVDTPDVAPRQLLSWPEAVSGPLVTWDDTAVIFSADQGGDEQARFYRADMKTGQARCLTPEPLNRDAPLLPESASDQLFYSARTIDSAASAIYVASAVSPGPERKLYQSPGAGSLVDVNQDGTRGLFIRFLTHQNQELELVDLESGQARKLFPQQGNAAITYATFSPDGRALYVATDAGGEGAGVLALDARTGAELARYREQQPPTAAPEVVTVSRQGDVVVATFDAGDHTVMRVLDAHDLRPRSKVDLPLGVVEAGGFSDDGQSFALCTATAEHPCTLQLLSTRTGAIRPLRSEKQEALSSLPPIEASITPIESFDGLRIPTNVFRPKKQGRVPVILFLHGGPAGASKVGWNPSRRLFLSEGYAVVEPNIRGSGGFGRTYEAADDGPKRWDSFRDIEAVRAWAERQPWADAQRLIIMGGSYGGFLVLSEISRSPGKWRAAVDLFGIADFISFMATTKGGVRENYLHEIGDPEKDRDLLTRLSPINAADAIRTPLFVYTGANDPRVPLAQSRLIVDALKRRGVPVEFMVGANEGHGVARRENQVEMDTRVMRFLEAQLGSPPAAQSAASSHR